MSKAVYRDSILQPVVKPWCDKVNRGITDLFVLEEDGDSGHGTNAPGYIIKKFKQEIGLVTYRNCAGLPDLALIENIWQAPKQVLRKHPY